MTIDEKLKFLKSSKDEFYSLAQKMLKADNGKLFLLDLYTIGIMNRSVLLIKGFSDLIENNNFLSAAPLIRLHLDSLLQFYAAFIVKDPHDFSQKKMSGKQSNNLKDSNGEKLTDGYLAGLLSKENGFEWVKNVYKETSKFIHFSDKHIFSSAQNKKNNKFSFVISDKLDVPASAQNEAIDAMIEITQGLFKYIYGWIHTKQNLNSTIFTDNFPIITSNKELYKVKKEYPQYDEYYIASGCIKDRKNKFDVLWPKFKPYADTNFLKELKTNFHSRTWEMYMCNVLLEKSFYIKLPSNIPKNEGPDFILNNGTYIECIACSKGHPNKPNSVPEIQDAQTQEEIVAIDVPTDKMILRITNAIIEKAITQYEKWKMKQWFRPASPFIIAINSGDLSYPQDYLGIPLIIKALFGLEFMQISQNGNKSFSFRKNMKKGQADIPLTYFANNKFNFISGVIFSDRTVLNHPEKIGDDCIFVNNPFALYSVNDKDFSKFKSFKAEKGKFTKLY